jgi:hypothetical protein
MLIKWKGSRGWALYYITDRIRHGETTELARACTVTRERFEELADKRLIPASAEFVGVPE